MGFRRVVFRLVIVKEFFFFGFGWYELAIRFPFLLFFLHYFFNYTQSFFFVFFSRELDQGLRPYFHLVACQSIQTWPAEYRTSYIGPLLHREWLSLGDSLSP